MDFVDFSRWASELPDEQADYAFELVHEYLSGKAPGNLSDGEKRAYRTFVKDNFASLWQKEWSRRVSEGSSVLTETADPIATREYTSPCEHPVSRIDIVRKEEVIDPRTTFTLIPADGPYRLLRKIDGHVSMFEKIPVDRKLLESFVKVVELINRSGELINEQKKENDAQATRSAARTDPGREGRGGEGRQGLAAPAYGRRASEEAGLPDTRPEGPVT